MSPRSLVVTAALVTGAVLALALYAARVDTPLRTTLAPAFRLLGVPVQALDQLAGRVLPVGDLDERELGLVLRRRHAHRGGSDAERAYVNELLAHLASSARKPFDYRAYVIDESAPNALALPGGTVLVTRGLLAALRSESELVAVLAHELGHIERGHCFSAVKFELLARKLGPQSLGRLADAAWGILVRHAFSKSQEDDADEYAYAHLVHGVYDPRGVGRAFESLRRHRGGPDARPHADPIRDYFRSHPPLELRIDKYLPRAEAWWRKHPGRRRYVGRWNLLTRQSLAAGKESAREWVGS